MEGVVEKLVWLFWIDRFLKFVVAPLFLFGVGWGTLTVLERADHQPRSYITHLGQPVTTEPLYIAADDCRKLADVLALSSSARQEFTVACAK